MPKTNLNVQSFGEFRYVNIDNKWICSTARAYTKNEIEISFEVENKEQDLTEKLALMKKFVDEISVVEKVIFNHILEKIPAKTLDELKTLWFLSAIELKNDNQTWWIVLEPNFETETKYNHFLRFTIVKKEIIWSNFSN